MKFKRKVHILLAMVCFILCFAITLQYKSVTRNNSIEKEATNSNTEMENNLINARQQNIDLQKEKDVAAEPEVFTVIIDAGHGGEDGGAIGVDKKTLEKIVAEYDVLDGLYKDFHQKFSELWHKENKPFGFEIQDAEKFIKLGASRLGTSQIVKIVISVFATVL